MGSQALLWAALAHGTSRIEGLDARHAPLIAALRAMGVRIDDAIEGVGLRGLKIPSGGLQADAEPALVLLTSLLAGQTFGTRITGPDTSLRTLIAPLRARGAHVAGKQTDTDIRPPVAVAPLLADELLESVEIDIPFGDANTKLGLLVSGLYARGITAIREGMLSRDHVERALVALGLPVSTAAGMTLLDTSESEPLWASFQWQLPGDFTIASYLLAAALIVPDSDVTIEGVGLNPTRTHWFSALGGTGARVKATPKGDCAGNEPLGDLRAASSKLTRIRVGGERAFGLLDEVPALAALAVIAADRISIRDVTLLRARTPDAINGLRDTLARFGVSCTTYEDGLEVDPPEKLRGATVEGDSELALLGCVLGLVAEGETVVEDVERLDARYPGVLSALQTLGADVEREQ